MLVRINCGYVEGEIGDCAIDALASICGISGDGWDDDTFVFFLDDEGSAIAITASYQGKSYAYSAAYEAAVSNDLDYDGPAWSQVP